MKNFLLLASYVTLNLFASPSMEAVENNQSHPINFEEEFIVDGDKIYLNSDNIVVEQEGISFFHKGCAIPLQTLHSDEKGIYIFRDEINASCKKGHRSYCPLCGGCDKIWCEGRCRCLG